MKGSTVMTPNPVPGPLRKFTAAVVRTVLPTGIPPLAVVAVRVGVRVWVGDDGTLVRLGVRVLVAETGTLVLVGVADAPGPETSVIYALAIQPVPKLPMVT